jgi:DNA-binding Lrp family transcriptional regulator
LPGNWLDPAEPAGIFERLNCSGERRQSRVERLAGDRLLRRFYASTDAKLREIGERLDVPHLVNLTGCPVR